MKHEADTLTARNAPTAYSYMGIELCGFRKLQSAWNFAHEAEAKAIAHELR